MLRLLAFGLISSVLLLTSCAAPVKLEQGVPSGVEIVREPEPRVSGIAQGETAEMPESGGEKMELVWKFRKGQRLEYVRKHFTSLRQCWDEEEVPQTLLREYVVAYEVLDVDEKGIATIRSETSSIKIKKTDGSRGIEKRFDSTRKGDIERARGDSDLRKYVLMLEKPVTFRMDKSGKILEVKGYAEMMEEAYGGRPMSKMIKRMYSNEAYGRKLEQTYALLPKQEVGRGDSWVFTNEIPRDFPKSIQMEYKMTCDGIEKLDKRSCVRIKGELTKFSAESPQMHTWVFAKKEGSTILYMDPEDGVLVKSEDRITFALDMMPDDPSSSVFTMVEETVSSSELKEAAKQEPGKEKSPKQEEK
jgi:hypothetical protein